MEKRSSLFKANSSLLREKNSNIKAANEIRAKQRRNLCNSRRNISPLPSPKKPSEQKENLQPTLETLESDVTKPPPSKQNEKSLRQKAFLLKYLAWKTKKVQEEQAKKEQCKRPPFVPCGSGPANGTRNMKKSFVPKNHIFRPPPNLEDLTIDIVGQYKLRCVSGNQEAIYNFVPTPKKENNKQSKTAVQKLRNPILKPEVSEPVIISKTINTKNASIASKCVPQNTINSKAAGPPITKTVIKAKPHSTMQNGSDLLSKPRLRPPPIQKPEKPLVKIEDNIAPKLGMPPPPQRFPKNSKKATTSKMSSKSSKTVNSQSGLPPLKRPTFKASKKVGISVSNAFSTANPNSLNTVFEFVTSTKRKSLSLKNPKVDLFTAEGSIVSPVDRYATAIPDFIRYSIVQSESVKTQKKENINSQSGLPLLKSPTFKASNAFSTVHGNMNKEISANTCKYLLPNAEADAIVSETPDPNSLNKVFEFVTSTKRKSLSLKNSKVDLFTAENSIVSPVDSYAPAIPDFIRYSIVQSGSKKTPKQEEETTKKSSEGGCTKEESVTPIKDNIENTTPPIYMSPYVSVSRGKVNKKIEREKRNSVYMGTDTSSITEAVAAEHHTMATVQYYRKQLMGEVDRLNERCRVWEEYKNTSPQLEDVGGTDMIDATIGQTKLLINKKLKQFGGLIDSCEEGLRRKNTANNGDNKSFLPVLPQDLDGFWSMVGLQIENVDKRFANIERWKANNWSDPDEEPKERTNVKKMKKSKPATTARPNQALQKMLKAAHAACLKKKAMGDADNDVILTPSRRQVVIKDRRSRSAAATIITISAIKAKRISSEKNQSEIDNSPKITPHINAFRESMNVFKRTLLGEQDCKSLVNDNVISPKQTSSRNSILKTPGSIRFRSKNVIFSNNAPQFTSEDTLNDLKSDREQDVEEDQRTYKLRNRRIILRDSAEFVIPK